MSEPNKNTVKNHRGEREKSARERGNRMSPFLIKIYLFACFIMEVTCTEYKR